MPGIGRQSFQIEIAIVEVQPDPALIDAVVAVEHLQQRALADTAASGQHQTFTGLQRQREIAHHVDLDPALAVKQELLVQPVHREARSGVRHEMH